MKIVALSDTHNFHDQIVVPDGDMAIHCGDWSNLGKLEEIHSFLSWFSSLPHEHKVRYFIY